MKALKTLFTVLLLVFSISMICVNVFAADICTGGAITASGENAPYEGKAQAFDDNVNTKWLTFASTGWIAYDFSGTSVYAVNSYTVTSANDWPTRDPKSWTLQGSNNGTTWTTVDTRTNVTFSARFQKLTFNFTNTTAYQMYRLNITANGGDSALQLAEIEMFASSSGAIFYQNTNYGGTATSVIPPGNYTLSQLQAYGFVNDWASSCKTGGYTVIMYINDNFSGTSWTLTADTAYFTNLSPSANDLVTSVKIQSGSGATPTATRTPTPTPGQTPSPTSTPSGDPWAGFTYPTIDFVDNAVGLEGSTIFHNAVPDVTQMMKDTCLAICKKLYTGTGDNMNNFTYLHLELNNDPNLVAAKWGSQPNVYIGIGAQYIANFYHNNGNSLAAVRSEVQGILGHEGTHGYQFEPKNCGTYDGSSEFYAFIEGMADYVRAVTYQWTPPRSPGRGGDWHNGYTTTGFFIKWICDTKKASFAIDFNHAAGTYATFSWDTACRNITGIGVAQLWSEYQASLP